MASEPEAGILEVVEQLQAGLLWLPHPKKVLKYMKRLDDLPMTTDILKETGIGKTVKSLCRYEEVGAMAQDIVGRWESLAPVDEDSDSDPDFDLEEQDSERSRSRKRPHDVCSKEGDFQKTCKSSYSQPPSPDFRDKKHPKLWELERGLRVSPDSERREERTRCNQILPLDGAGSDRVQLQPSAHLPQPSIGCSNLQEEKDQQFDKDSAFNVQNKVKTFQESQVDDPLHVKPGSLKESKETKSYPKEKYPVNFEGQKKNLALNKKKLPNVASQEADQKTPSEISTKEKQNDTTRREKDKEGSSVKRYFPPLELTFVKHIPKTKHPDPPKSKPEKNQLSKDVDPTKWIKDKGVSNNLQTQEGKYKAPVSHKSTGHCPLGSREPEAHEQPSTSFGSNLGYAWQPQKKKTVKIPMVVHGDKGHIKENTTRTDSKSPNAVQKLPKMSDGPPEKQQSGPMLGKLKNISTFVTPHLGDTPLPAVQASCQFPSLETPSTVKSKKKTASYHEEEGAGFTGRRMNSKMHVYSGPKSVYQPRLISLHQQCIRVLNNNLDSILDIGKVPYTVLEPVLEKCTPKQLHRIEEYNHLLIEETDQLWKFHCHRDFKREKPKEFESWRELYLRLQEAREQRLLLLTENIRSAHAKKPKGRQTMMTFVNSVAKPPQDIRRKQEKIGTDIATVPEIIKPKTALYTPTPHHCRSAIHPYGGPSTSSTHSTSSASSIASGDSRRTPMKKIAPMMAKTIKAFKNRFSRR